jgi:hypothetical protein
MFAVSSDNPGYSYCRDACYIAGVAALFAAFISLSALLAHAAHDACAFDVFQYSGIAALSLAGVSLISGIVAQLLQK